MRKKIISSISGLKPYQIVNTNTGEISETQADKNVRTLLDYVQQETIIMYDNYYEQFVTDVENAEKIGSANSFGRKHGYMSNYKTLPRDVKAKSRVNELILHKFVSETLSYVNNPNLLKQAPSFNKKINLGAVDKQMAKLFLEGNTLILQWKVWFNEYEFYFQLPDYVFKKNIIKFSLPTVRLNKQNELIFNFSVQESVVPNIFDKQYAGIDLGRVEPYVMSVINKDGGIAAQYGASGRLKLLNNKRERLLKQSSQLFKKAKQYRALGLIEKADVLDNERKFVRAAASRLVSPISWQAASEVSKKLAKHEVSVLGLEELGWAVGEKYGSKWAFARAQDAIEHSLARGGVKVRKVKARNTSQVCHKCGVGIVHDDKKRTVFCGDCKTTLDRDLNASLNIVKRVVKSYPVRCSRNGDSCSSKEQAIENKISHKSVASEIINCKDSN